MFNDQAVREIHLALYYKTQGFSRADIADLMGITPALVKTRLAQVKSALITMKLPHPECQKSHPISTLELRREAVSTQVTQDVNREANTVARNLARKEHVNDSLIEAMKKLIPPRAKTNINSLLKQSKSGVGTVWVTISDVHVGKHTESFTKEDALNAITGMIEAGLEAAKTRNAKELVIALLGDILDGYGIYRSQVSEVSLTATEQFTVVLQCLADAIETVLANFSGTLTIVGIPGNHGRVNTPEVATWENFERLLYNTLELWFRDEDRINFVLPSKESFYVIYKGVFAFHGHEINGSGTLDGIIQRVRQWLTLFNGNWKLSLCGHFHRLMLAHYPQDRIHLVNGTASKGDGFIERLGGSHANKWWMFFQDAQNNITEFVPVDLY